MSGTHCPPTVHKGRGRGGSGSGLRGQSPVEQGRQALVSSRRTAQATQAQASPDVHAVQKVEGDCSLGNATA